MASTLDNSLIDVLVPVIDTIRENVYGAVGNRQYDVAVVRRTWPSGRRGDTSGGAPVDTALTLSPRPRVQFGNGMDFQMEPAGRREDGSCKLSEVSLTYSEEQLSPVAVPPDQEFFYRLTDAKGQNIAPRYYSVSGPLLSDREESIGWIINLVRRQVKP